MDNKEIILAQIASIYDKPPFVLVKEGQMKMILRCAGLGEYYDKYCEYLEPHYYNRSYKNNVESYRIFVGLDAIFSDLLATGNEEKILTLLTELGRNIPSSIFYNEEKYCDDYYTLENLYQLMGLEFHVENYDEYDYRISVTAFTGSTTQLEQSFGMEQWLSQNYPKVYGAYKSALDCYAVGNLGSAIEACRMALTGIFSKFKGIPFKDAKWKLGLATVTGDFTGTESADRAQMNPINQEIESLVKSDISSFFGDNLDGSFKKTKAIYAVYSMLSDYGPHRQEGVVENATKEDTLLMVKMTTDILVWIYQKNS